MDRIVRVAHRIARKFFKKRRSIGGQIATNGYRRASPLPRPSMDDTTVEENDLPPPTPSFARSLDILRVATPAKSLGIIVHEECGQESESVEDEEAVSQAEDCIDWDEWNEPAHDIHIDTSAEFVLFGGDDSSSVLCEEEVEVDIEEEKREEGREDNKEQSKLSDFIFEDEYIDDDLDTVGDIADLQSTSPVEEKWKEECSLYPTTFVADDDGYEWKEPVGFTDYTLAPLVSSNLAFPALCGLNDEALTCLARSLMEEDTSAMNNKKEWSGVNNSTYVVPTEIECGTKRWATSTPVVSFSSPAFSSISTITPQLNDSSRTFYSPSCNDSLSIGGKTYTLDVGVRCRAALARPMEEYLHVTYDLE